MIIVGLLATAAAMHFSLCRWRYGSSGSEIAIFGGPSATPTITSPIYYGGSWHGSGAFPDANWAQGGVVYYAAPSQPQHGLFARMNLLASVIGGVVTPILLITGAFATLCTLRRTRRLERGCCPRCGYDLRFDDEKRCSECGWKPPATV